MAKVRKSILVWLLIIVLSMSFVVMCGCNEKEKEVTLLSREDIDRLVHERFYDENGKINMNLWGNFNEESGKWEYYVGNEAREGYPYWESDEVTGYTVTYIKDIKKPRSTCKHFLVEFEPSGYIIGTRSSSRLCMRYFFPYPSVYKFYDIPKADRYCDASYYGEMTQPITATKIDGTIVIVRCRPILSEGEYSLDIAKIQYGDQEEKLNSIETYNYELKVWVMYSMLSEQYYISPIEREGFKTNQEELLRQLEAQEPIDYDNLKAKLLELRINSPYYKTLDEE